MRRSPRGHLYFELVEKGAGDRIVGKLDAVVWRSDLERVQRMLRREKAELTDGQQVRCYGRVDFYAAGGRLQLIVRELDPLFTLGHLERRRRETLQALTEAGLMERNRRRELAPLPLRLGLVTSRDSAAYHDFLAGLSASGYGFQVTFVAAAVQGEAAEREVASAVRALGRLPLDAVVVVRGGGARTDLAAFDSRAVAEAVARCPLPVITGLGHETDRSLTDLVSHSAVKTPSGAAELLVGRVADADARLHTVERDLRRSAEARLRTAGDELRRLEAGLRASRWRLAEAQRRVTETARSLAAASRRRLAEASRSGVVLTKRLARALERRMERAGFQHRSVGERLAGLSRARLAVASARLDGVERLCRELAPERLLERGFSITRTAEGRLLTSAEEVGSGDVIVSQLRRGSVTSRVEEP